MKNQIMDWNHCKKAFLRQVQPDLEKTESLKKKAMKRLKRARTGTDVDFVSEDYYEVIKELLTAYLLKNGLRSKNHQCLISYFLKENPKMEREAYIIQQMSYFRNRLGYYGEDVPKEFLQTNKEEIEKVIKYILGLIENE
jgi:uncharacterized protein (UPF0332 family)